MLGPRQLHLEVELLKWLAVLAIAAAIALAWVTRAAGSEATGGLDRPQLLPPDMEEVARPLAETWAAEPPVAADDQIMQRNLQLWSLLELHRQGQLEEVLAGWHDLVLPCESEVWRYVALGAANLQIGRLEDAADMLDAAKMLEPENPLVHYFTGMLRMQQAAEAQDWLDVDPARAARLVAYVPRELAPNTRGMYEQAAIEQLERTLELAPQLARTMLLIPPDSESLESASMPWLPAMVEDLLLAIGADNFEGKTHNMLSYLYMDRGWLEQAEEHMDGAAATGLKVLYGYSDLGARYEAEQQHLDAARSYLKHMTQGGPVVQPARQCLKNLRRAMVDMF